MLSYLECGFCLLAPEAMMTAPHSSAISRAAALLSVTLLAIVLPQAESQMPFIGACPQKGVIQNFNASRYLGKWYEQERYITVFQIMGNCVTTTYTDEGNGKVGVQYKHVNLFANKTIEMNGTPKPDGVGTEGKFVIEFPSAGDFTVPYWILDIDYENYAILWFCRNYLFLNTQFAWVVTRAKHPTTEVWEKINDSLEAHGINPQFFITSVQRCDN